MIVEEQSKYTHQGSSDSVTPKAKPRGRFEPVDCCFDPERGSRAVAGLRERRYTLRIQSIVKFPELHCMTLSYNIVRYARIAFLLLLVVLLRAGAQQKQIIGYYPGWKWYDRNAVVKPSTIPYDRYTIINYAFLKPAADGRLVCPDPWGEKNLLLGDIDWSVTPAGYETSDELGNPAYHKPRTSIAFFAHAAGVKLVISVGGWTQSDLFPSVAADPVKRRTFAHWCNEAMRRYDADGVDIDWEGPGYVPHNGSPADKANFTLLLRAIRDSLDAHATTSGRPMLLTAAVGVDAESMRNIEWTGVSALLDYINLMTYELAGTWNAETNHLAPLYRAAQGDTANNIHSSVRRLLDFYRVPSQKIVLGIPYYGLSLNTVGAPALFAASRGSSDSRTFPAYGGAPQYFDMVAKAALFDERWDSVAQAPYYLGKNGLQTFVSCDNPRSVALKAQYVIENGLGGAMVWELTGDCEADSGAIVRTALADTLAHALRSAQLVDFIPYLQAPTPTSITISWHDAVSRVTRVDYGTTAALGSSMSGTSERIDEGVRWHTVTLTGLRANTEYFYRCVSGSGTSSVYPFRTAPDSTFDGHLRMLLIGDTRTDTAQFALTLREAKRVLEQRYGPALHHSVQLFAHLGDIVTDGGNAAEYRSQFFRPMGVFSTSLPTAISIGNHEFEHENYYRYMHFDRLSAFPDTLPPTERWYSLRLARAVFLFLNSNLDDAANTAQLQWLDRMLRASEKSADVDWVFAFVHAPSRTELRPGGNSTFVERDVLGLLRGCSKATQLANGHSHSYARGAVTATAAKNAGDVAVLQVAGGGAPLDRWGMYPGQTDYPEMQATYEDYNFVLIDIDTKARILDGTAYSLGNPDRPTAATVLDQWHRRVEQSPPRTPAALVTLDSASRGITLVSSAFDGADSLMTAEVQLARDAGATIVLDSTRDWRDIYGSDSLYRPVDLNAGIDLTRLRLPDTLIDRSIEYAWRVRYRDQNLRWSAWSDFVPLLQGAVGVRQPGDLVDFHINGIFPQPVRGHAALSITLEREAQVRVDVFAASGMRVRTLDYGTRVRGLHLMDWDGLDQWGVPLPGGTYLLQLRINGRTATARALLLR
jgi:chitinase